MLVRRILTKRIGCLHLKQRNKSLHTSSIVVSEFGSPDVMKYVDSHEIREEISENEILVKLSAAVRHTISCKIPKMYTPHNTGCESFGYVCEIGAQRSVQRKQETYSGVAVHAG